MLNVVALSLAPQSIISALVVLVLVFNTIFAPFLLKNEHVQKIDIIGISIIIVGVILAVIFGPRTEESYTSDELLNFFISTAFLIYGSIIVGLVIALVVYNHIAEKADKNEKKFKDLNTTLGKFSAFAYAVLPAILSSFNSLFSKIVGELVKTTIKGSQQFTNWRTYVFIIVFAFVDASQVVYLQRALRAFDALLIIPLYQVSLVIFGVTTGGIYFHEFQQFGQKPVYYPIFFVVGLLLSVAGVIVLSKRDLSEELHPDKVLNEENPEQPKNK